MEYLEALAKWQQLKADIAALQEQERALREGLFAGTFPQPHEGVNEYTLPDGRTVKGTYKLNRKLDEAILTVVLKEMGITKGLAPVRTKTELDLTKYRKMPDDKRVIFDKCLTVTPGLPQLEVVVPQVDTVVAAPFSG